MKDHIKGQGTFPLVILTALVMQGANWTADYFLKSPEKADTKIEILANKLTTQTQILSTLCNDYGQTISRLDQNVQNIGRSFNVPVVIGKSNSNPCEDAKTISVKGY